MTTVWQRVAQCGVLDRANNNTVCDFGFSLQLSCTIPLITVGFDEIRESKNRSASNHQQLELGWRDSGLGAQAMMAIEDSLLL